METNDPKFDYYENIPRVCRRSEARQRYYNPSNTKSTKRSTSRTNSQKSHTYEKKPSMKFKETFIFQATICGGFLAILLFLNILDTDFTNSITFWVGQNISHDITSDEEGSVGWINSITNIFTQSPSDQIAPAYIEAQEPHNQTQSPYTTPSNNANTQAAPAEFSVESSRIDENILRYIIEAN